ncbi:MAG: OprD family porin [Desulfarculaceae bacterium]|nr:OprD family porin [Desulfarculaceae bacterium]
MAPSRPRFCSVMALACLLVCLSAGPGGRARAATPGYLTDEITIPDSVYQRPTPLSNLFAPERAEGLRVQLEENLKDLPPFWRDSKLHLNLRSFVFYTHSDPGGLGRDWALGGRAEYTSGWLAQRLQVGLGLYTTQPLYAPQNDLPTLLLSPDGEGITVLGLAYLRVRLIEKTDLYLFRQSFDLPFLNRRDSKMIPNTFEAYTLLSQTWPVCHFILSQVTRIKQRDAASFVSMSQAAGAAGSDEGLSLGGLVLSPLPGFKVGFVNQYSWEVTNTLYAEADYENRLGPLEYKLSLQYTDQRSVGEQLVGPFTSNAWGVQLHAGLAGAVLSVAYTEVDPEAGLIHPYGGYPGFTSLIVQSFNQAGERAWVAGLSYDLARLGLKGWSAFANYAQGSTPSSEPDEREADLTVDYRPLEGPLQGFWLRLRGAHVEQSGPGASDTQQYQLILNYDLNLP